MQPFTLSERVGGFLGDLARNAVGLCWWLIFLAAIGAGGLIEAIIHGVTE